SYNSSSPTKSLCMRAAATRIETPLENIRLVSYLAFVYNQDCPLGYLVSGSGDSTVRLWDHTLGLLLHTCTVRSSPVGRGFVPLDVEHENKADEDEDGQVSA
nr:tRNA (guanine-N(7)-)-methyltransferase non-catalytic subunit wdr4 [Tanacetum cinerariifolium]